MGRAKPKFGHCLLVEQSGGRCNLADGRMDFSAERERPPWPVGVAIIIDEKDLLTAIAALDNVVEYLGPPGTT